MNLKIASAVSLALALTVGKSFALKPVRDDFNKPAVDQKLWISKNFGSARFRPAKGRMEFGLVGKPTGNDYSSMILRYNQPGYNENWEVILDVRNFTGRGENVGMGIAVFNAVDLSDGATLMFHGTGAKGGVVATGFTNDREGVAGRLQPNPGGASGSLRLSFNKSNKLLTFWFDSDGPARGYSWKKISTFSTNGTGGDQRGNWSMNPGSGSFIIWLLGYSGNQPVPFGKVGFDNFQLNGLR